VLAAELGAVVSGLDAAAAMIKIAQEKVPAGNFRVGDIQELPFDDNSFDAVIAANSVQYSEDRIATLQELRRVVSEGGKVVVGLFSTPDKVQYSAIIGAVRDTLPESPPGNGPFELSVPGVLEDLIQRAGLTIQNSGEVECPFTYPDFGTLWRVNVAAGPFQATKKLVSEERLKTAIMVAAQPFQDGNGSIHFENVFFYVTAMR
jgi:SAM-dependent methyltransferase